MYSTVRTDPVLEEYNTIEPEPAEGTEEWHLKYGYGNSPKPQESAAPVVEQRELNPREKILQAYQRLIETQEKPKFDTESQEYLQRAAKYNAIGKGLSNLAEIFSLAKGGNVPGPEKDGKIQSYIGKYFQNIDDYRDKVDRYNIMNNQNQMRFHEMLYRDALDAEAKEKEQSRYDDNIAYRNKKDEKEEARWREQFEANQNNMAADNQRQQDALDWQKKSPYVQHGLRMDELNQKIKGEMMKYEARSKFNGKNFNLYDDAGNTIATLEPGEAEKLVQMILKDPETSGLATADINLMKAQLGDGLSKQNIMTIVAYYWSKSPMAMKYLGQPSSQKESFDFGQYTNQRPAYNGPVRTEGTTQPKIKVNDPFEF